MKLWSKIVRITHFCIGRVYKKFVTEWLITLARVRHEEKYYHVSDIAYIATIYKI